MTCPIDQLTVHGHDMQFGTNVLGHFYLTQLLLPTLLASTKTSDGHAARIVNVSSSGHWGAPTVKKGGPVVYDTITDGPKRRKVGSFGMYFQSKAVSGSSLYYYNILLSSLHLRPADSEHHD